MKHIFLSYSREDSAMMRRVRDVLRDEGFVVWTDESLTPGTASWKLAIEQAIEAAGALLVLLSPTAKRSEWVNNELGYARTHDVSIFPVLVVGEDKDAVPLALINAQRVDLRTRFLSEMQALVDALREHLTRLDVDQEEALESAAIKLSMAWQPSPHVYNKFWKLLQSRSKTKTPLFAALRPPEKYYWSTSIGRRGFQVSYVISVRDWAEVNLYIDMGDRTKNKAAFDALYAQRAAIEQVFGAPLDWLRLDNKRASKIEYRLKDALLEREAEWGAMQDRLIDAMIRLDAAVRPPILALPNT
jgi:Domain of unknown function (DUF4268)/TIR domain